MTDLPVTGVRRALRGAAAFGLILAAVGPLRAQSPPVDTTSLATGPYATMCTLLEKTIFRVDVLTLTVRFGPGATDRLRSLAADADDGSAARDSIADVAIHAEDVWARIRFKRTVSLEQFVHATRANLHRAAEAGILTAGDAERIGRALPRWYAFLEDRKIREGDEILYRIRGDTLRSLFRTAEGNVLLDQTDVGPERPLSVLGGYLAPGSDFRDGLLRSLFRDRGPDGSCRVAG